MLPALPEGVHPGTARRAQLAGGDDYELVFAAPPGRRGEVGKIGSCCGLPLTRFGMCTEYGGAGRRLDLRAADGTPQTMDELGYDHFR
jgi:thiamine-monophosphate kinase